MFQALSYWKIFIVAVIISITAAYLFNKYADPIYQANSKVLIMTDNQNINPFSAGSFWKQPINIENEMAILRSFDLTQNALRNTEWKISYFRYGQIRENQMFRNSPFRVKIDSLHPQATSIKFDIEMISEKQFRLKVAPIASTISLYDYSTEMSIRDLKGNLPLGIDKVYNYGEKITTDLFSFTIDYVYTYNEDKEFYFYLNSLTSLASRYNGKFQVKPMHNDATVVLISIKDKSQFHAVELVNALTNAYVNYNLDFKNRQSANAIKFIDIQLAGIDDSLTYSEERLEDYRTDNKILNIEDVSSNSFDRLYSLDQQKAQAELQASYFKYLKEYMAEGINNKQSMVAPSVIGVGDPMLFTISTTA